VVLLLLVIAQNAPLPIAEIEASDMVGVGGPDLRPGIGVYQLKREQNRKGKMHRPPNLLAWADRIPVSTRVVVLDLPDAAQVDDNTALELRALIGRFHTEHRQLVLCGLTSEHYEQLCKARGSRAV